MTPLEKGLAISLTIVFLGIIDLICWLKKNP